MTKQKFTTTALDQLVNESIAEADEFKDELSSIDETQLTIHDSDELEEDDYLTDADKTFREAGNVVRSIRRRRIVQLCL
jgi:hypothetical protein